jgi:hypothetical protein
MKNTLRLAASAAVLALAAGPAWAEGPAVPAWATAFAGEKLVAVDGSTLTLGATDGGLTLTRISPAGATQSIAYTFMSEKMGSIADGGDASHVTGFFRITEIGLNAEYSDGHTEQMFANTGGGISLTGHGGSAAGCMSWYRADHTFGAAERRAAVAAYAASLGVAQTGKGKASPVATCPAPTQTRIAHTVHEQAPGLLAPATAVRDSEVHAVNDSQPVAAVPGAAVTASLQPAKLMMVAASAPAPVVLAAATPVAAVPVAATTVAAAAPAQEPGHGASNCLSVESDGANLGFRNHCIFNVQFAYCLQNKDDPQALCNVETRAGTVPANAFVALLSGTNIRPEDAEHDFRWVACSGTGISAYLDRAEPPSGRCVRPNAS